MVWRRVVVNAWVPDVAPGTPTHPIAPGGEGPVDPGYGVEAPVDPGWGVPAPPVRPTHPIAPGGPPPRPDQGLPVPPAYPDNTLPVPPGPVDPGYGIPAPPSRPPVSPIIPEDLDAVGGHPELPDMSQPGQWVQVAEAKMPPSWGWLGITAPSQGGEPVPPTRGTPGTWVMALIASTGMPSWVWIPSPKSEAPPTVDNTLPGDQPGVDNTLPGDQPQPDQSLPGDQPEVTPH
jgi:hypothetical protein